MLADNFNDFNEVFAPFDENYAMEIADKIPSPRLPAASSVMDSLNGGFSDQFFLPPGIPEDELFQIEAQQEMIINPPPMPAFNEDGIPNPVKALTALQREVPKFGGGLSKVVHSNDSKNFMNDEIEALQRRLVKDRINIKTNVLHRAFMLPEQIGGARQYPSPAYGLMPSIPKKEEKKTKKKRRVISP